MNVDAPRAARALVAELARGVDDRAAANLYLAVSELVTNAVMHGPEGDMMVRVLRRPRAVRLEVQDAGTEGFTWPELHKRDQHSPHGLELVEAFTDRCGVAQVPQTLAWCEIDLAA